ncbi:hypothetical protein INT46_003147 [Mucor plumbeus]|uniref:Uncharacterized protein n=1 Tax=Mucor plumbeus TaxID=97098 RepID=A0A8H7V0H0_9FUNG|nr:hypothetical protein INT46_003147 [Mucor plumbeus]
MLTTRFCHYFPSGAFVCDDIDTEEFQYQPKETEATIKKLYRLKILSDIPISSNKEESLDTVMETEEFKLGLSHLPSMIWTPTKYKPSQMDYNKWKTNGGTVLPGYKLASEVKVKHNNVKLTEHHSQFINNYVEKHPTCNR